MNCTLRNLLRRRSCSLLLFDLARRQGLTLGLEISDTPMSLYCHLFSLLPLLYFSLLFFNIYELCHIHNVCPNPTFRLDIYGLTNLPLSASSSNISHIHDPSPDPPNMSDPRAKINYGVPYYSQVEFINDEFAIYRSIYIRPNTRSDSEKWEPRV
jgi:hypothetical protein